MPSRALKRIWRSLISEAALHVAKQTDEQIDTVKTYYGSSGSSVFIHGFPEWPEPSGQMHPHTPSNHISQTCPAKDFGFWVDSAERVFIGRVRPLAELLAIEGA
jgi:hypothetical protein